MGFLWDLYQQSQISRHVDRADTLERRVAALEDELERHPVLVRDLIGRLEATIGSDVDGDGRVG